MKNNLKIGSEQHKLKVRGLISIVLRPGPVQGPSFGFCPGHRVLTGSAGSVLFLIKTTSF